MAKTRKGSRKAHRKTSRKAHRKGSRKTMRGGASSARKEWTSKVMSVYKDMKKSNPNVRLGDAMKKASALKKAGKL